MRSRISANEFQDASFFGRTNRNSFIARTFSVNTRRKAFALFFACCAAPLLAVCAVLYLISARAVATQLRQDTTRDANHIAQRMNDALREREADLNALASGAMRFYLIDSPKPQSAPVTGGTQSRAAASKQIETASVPARFARGDGVPQAVRADVDAFLLYNQRYFTSVTCLDKTGQPLFRAERKAHGGIGETIFQTENFIVSNLRADERVWQSHDKAVLRSPVMQESSGAIVRFTVPLMGTDENSGVIGAVIADLNLDGVFEESIDDRSVDSSTPHAAVVLDRAGQIVYHTNEALRHQTIARVMPYFEAVAAAMRTNEHGWQFFDSPEGKHWLAAYRSVPALDLFVAVAGDYSTATANLRRALWFGLAFSLLAGLVAAALLTRFVGRTRGSIERVTENAVAIAEGNLDQRIEVRSSDEMSLLAETFNQMTERLREQLAREAETKQFESFMRLSAMLTHDLKNAIASLSMIVRNMERQFHRAEFRADAMQSLTEATDKLRVLVSKLSDPVQSLSGEHPLPHPHDLIPVIGRVLARSVEPASGLYEIETHLPASLIAVIDIERIEKVIENLILNALEAMGTAGGKLSIEAGIENEREVFFSVCDTGPGMSEEFQHTKLFRAFSTTKKKGVGLGLYTCREVVKAHGGRIEVESKQGAGTSFRVVLPSKAAALATTRD